MGKATRSHRQRLKRYKSDFEFYARHCLKIVNKEGEIVPFILNRAQRQMWREVKADLDARRPVRIYVLKARQLGSSTFFLALQFWHCTLWKNRGGLLFAHELDAAKNLFNREQFFHNHLPEEIRPELQQMNRAETVWDVPKGVTDRKGLNSRIAIKTAENIHGSASFTLSSVVFSEFARYESVQKGAALGIATTLQSVPKKPHTFVAYESTAWGLGFSKDVWDNPQSGFRKVFISWFADDEYRDEHPLDYNDLEGSDNSKYGNEHYVYQVALKELAYWYPELSENEIHVEALHRMNWRRKKITNDFNGDLRLFKQEYPATPEEAFLTTGHNVFPLDKLYSIRARLEERDDIGEVVKYPYPPTKHRYDKLSDTFVPDKFGDLKIYHKAEAHKRYVIGVDVSEGISDGDYSVAQVLEVPSLTQVAVYRGLIDPNAYADLLYALGREYNWAFLAVEVNGPGFATNYALARNLYYPSLYIREQFDTMGRSKSPRYGWQTNRATKNVMISDLRGAIRDDEILFRDLQTLDELGTYVEDEGKFGAAPGKKDDTVMALAIALQQVLLNNFGTLKPPPKKDDYWTFNWFARLADRFHDQEEEWRNSQHGIGM
jgi:hypothetical protein